MITYVIEIIHDIGDYSKEEIEGIQRMYYDEYEIKVEFDLENDRFYMKSKTQENLDKYYEDHCGEDELIIDKIYN